MNYQVTPASLMTSTEMRIC